MTLDWDVLILGANATTGPPLHADISIGRHVIHNGATVWTTTVRFTGNNGRDRALHLPEAPTLKAAQAGAAAWVERAEAQRALPAEWPNETP